jgi:hypothetical protein
MKGVHSGFFFRPLAKTARTAIFVTHFELGLLENFFYGTFL